MELTEKLTGWFDVKVYNDRQPRENWKLKADEDNISFTTTFEQCPPALQEFSKQYQDSIGNTRHRVTFKIGSRCNWFDANAQPVQRPSNADLDGRRFEVRIQYNTVRPTDPNNAKAPRGYWANAVQFREVQDNPFAAFDAQPVPQPAPFAAPQQTVGATRDFAQQQWDEYLQQQQQQPQQQQQQQPQQGYRPPVPPPLGGQMPPIDGNPFEGSGDPDLPY